MTRRSLPARADALDKRIPPGGARGGQTERARGCAAATGFDSPTRSKRQILTGAPAVPRVALPHTLTAPASVPRRVSAHTPRARPLADVLTWVSSAQQLMHERGISCSPLLGGASWASTSAAASVAGSASPGGSASSSSLGLLPPVAADGPTAATHPHPSAHDAPSLMPPPAEVLGFDELDFPYVLGGDEGDGPVDDGGDPNNFLK